MITSRIKIGDDVIYDFESKFGFVYISSDNVFAAPIKDFEKTSYAEESGVHILPLTNDNEFEYKAQFFINAKGSVDVANWKIEEFNSSLFEEYNGLKRFKEITFFNDYKGVKIVGYAQPVQKATEFWRDRNGKQHDVVCVELIIHVVNPSLCNFNLASESFEAFYVQSEAFYVKKG